MCNENEYPLTKAERREAQRDKARKGMVRHLPADVEPFDKKQKVKVNINGRPYNA